MSKSIYNSEYDVRMQYRKEMEDLYNRFQQKYVKATNLKPGDKVKVLRKANSYEFCWINKWSPKMDKYVGKIVTVDTVDMENGIVIHDSNDRTFWGFPFFVLEKIDTYRFKDKEPVLVRDNNNQAWMLAAFKRYERNKYGYSYRVYTTSTDDNATGWRWCIPYKGNEHLLGTI